MNVIICDSFVIIDVKPEIIGRKMVLIQGEVVSRSPAEFFVPPLTVAHHTPYTKHQTTYVLRLRLS